MRELWERHGRRGTIILYIIFVTCSVGTSLLIFPTIAEKLGMALIQFCLTTLMMFVAYKIADKMIKKSGGRS